MPSRFLTETQKYDILQEWVLASKAPPSQNREIVLLPSKPYSKQARLLVMFFLFPRDWIVSESVFILQSTRKVKSYFSKLKLRGNWSPERLANFFSVLSRENSWSLSGGERGGGGGGLTRGWWGWAPGGGRILTVTNFRIFGVRRDSKWESWLKRNSCCLLTLTISWDWPHNFPPLETTLIR